MMLANSPISLLGLFSLALQAIPQVASAPYQVTFDQFLATVKAASFPQWKDSAVDDEQSFAQIKAHILDMYSGVGNVAHSFLHDGRYADCIDINRQPSLADRLLATAPEAPPSPPPVSSSGGPKGSGTPAVSPLTQNLKDPFGNDISCPDGTIPFARLTLERITTYPTLTAFFAKSTNGAGQALSARGVEELESRGPSAQEPHLYAYSYQPVTNYGGHSWLNLWSPVGDFSISQQWYVGGSGASTQTVEGGWIVYPQKFSAQAVLFIFYTPDDYSTGCYNLECKGFVQINNNWQLGGTFGQYSVTGGVQKGVDLQWYFYQGNWWLYLRGAGAYDAVGYYPGSIYNGGQLTKSAQLIEYGGEVLRFTTAVAWPQMGSGMFPDKGFEQAAYQNAIFYSPPDVNGSASPTVWSDLTKAVIGSRSCWDINITESAQGGDWGTFFFFGGPGGDTCQ
ncbi:uncharacterized protein LACBIDRAFT_307948 [Laccaria bicolor S238N-H82]|uniref:Predicted protein n=1 Tax=Laccaria bicolor (strain S238N-H82 / ATCC MYA-4686) TaxID=486041 RepID=B0DR99_LACBS|nr:uncharacterized protein LACBIDRAFT_307948 [Laccaria bicolor S238N-H82]EDR02747.1 predicted protein [Laccaria bicolor S238N-H82]|eukprot:XP_001886457.1 predicted protein [Laccaria bicolor S238N-H82]